MYQLHIQSYNHPSLKSELTQALQIITEQNSRKILPVIWRFVDWLHRNTAVQSAGKPARRIRNRVYGFVLLAMGLFLLVPGLMSPKELAVPLIAGILACSLGFLYLQAGSRLQSAPRMMKRFEASADKLMKSLSGFRALQSPPPIVSFDETGMTLPDATSVPYETFELLVETSCLLVLTWENRVTVLQKSDIVEGAVQDLITHLAMKTGKSVHSCGC